LWLIAVIDAVVNPIIINKNNYYILEMEQYQKRNPIHEVEKLNPITKFIKKCDPYA